MRVRRLGKVTAVAGLCWLVLTGCAATKPATSSAVPVASAGAASASASVPPAGASELERGRATLHSLAGCYIVDYGYHESKALKPGYGLDARVYDPNAKRTVMEWIVALDPAPNHVRLQHVLFFLDDQQQILPDSLIRHQAEDWELEAPWVWTYLGDSRWKREDISARRGEWVRRITNLDDGLRYQCVAPWRDVRGRREWECGDNFSPIPGRETRDMGRKDYQALLRHTQLVLFPGSWVEKQRNVKTVVKDGAREPLAEEVGRNWYVRVPDSHCEEAARWTAARLPYWELLRETWGDYFAKSTEWRERPAGSGPPRWAKMGEVEERYLRAVGANAAEARAQAERDIRAIIEADRLPVVEKPTSASLP